MKRLATKIALFITLIDFLNLASAAQVQVEIYYSQTCEHCERVLKNFLPQYQEKYKNSVEFIFYEVEGNLENYEKLLDREEETGDKDNELPVIFIGNVVLGGEEEVYKRFDRELKKALTYTQQYAKIPKKDTSRIGSRTITHLAESTATNETLWVAFFFRKGCAHCDRTLYDLKMLQKRYPNPNRPYVFAIRSFDIAEQKSKLLHEVFSERVGVSDLHRLVTPAIFFPKHGLVYGEKNPNYFNIDSIAGLYPNGTSRFWEEVTETELKNAENRIKARFSQFNVAPVIFAGLLDGINPCAFGALIFFVAFLTIAGRSKKEIFMVGMAYTFATFLTYLSIGMGILSFLASLPIFRVIARWVYLATGIVAVIFGILSFLDFIKAQRGRVAEMTLQLPDGLKKRIHRIMINENEPRKTRRNFLVAAFTTGFLVSLLELACTGQVYLPTILYVLGIPGLRIKAYGYLLLYNIMFVIPLLCVFLITYLGTTSEQLNLFLKKRAGIIKLLTAVMFFTMAIFLWRTILIG